MGEVASLWAALGLRVDQTSWAKGDAALAGAKRSVDAIGDRSLRTGRGISGLGAEAEKAGGKLGRAGRDGAGGFDGLGKSAAGALAKVEAVGAAAGGVVLWLGGRAVKAGVDFNATLEESQVKIAGMLSVAKKSRFSDEIGSANTLMENLSRRASTLPGSTAEYVSMLGNIAQPVIDAGLSMKQLEDITVGATVAAKAFGVDAEAGARDIDQALQGQFHSIDRLTGKALGAAGFKGEEGRARFNALPQAQRAQELNAAFNTPQIKALAEAQGNTFKGMFSTLEDAWSRFQGAVAKPIFDALKDSIKDLNAWIDANKAKLQEVADQIGGALLTAFHVVGAAIDFFIEHGEFAKSLLIAIGVVLGGLAIAWAAGFWPVFAAIAAVTALVFGIRWLLQQSALVKAIAAAFFPVIGIIVGITSLVIALAKHPEKIKAAFVSMGRAISDAFEWVVDKIKAIGARIADFFTDDIPNAIRAAFEWLENAPVIGRLIKLVEKIGEVAAHPIESTKSAISRVGNAIAGLSSGPDGEQTKALPAGATGGSGTTIGSVSIPITVNSPSADPKAVAADTKKAFDEHWNNKLRRAMDAQ